MADPPLESSVRLSEKMGSFDGTSRDSPTASALTGAESLAAITGNVAHVVGLVGESDPRAVDARNLTVRVESIIAGTENKLRRLEVPYVMSHELSKVVEVAEILGKPLLLEGEPGSGKTALPYAIAAEKGLQIFHAQCKSTTSAQDLLYTFDDLAKLRDAQAGIDVSDDRKYVKLGPLGQAFSANEQVVLVIDEADKAKRDFMNDLLEELDQMSFTITQTGEQVSSKVRPLVFITSNHEKDLPEPALRRCVYYYMDFPTDEHMAQIVKAHMPDLPDVLLDQALDQFYEMRAIKGIQKKPSTSEMIDWLKVLSVFGVKDLQGVAPHLETLIKNRSDLRLILQHQKEMQATLLDLGITRDELQFCFDPEPIVNARKNNHVSQRVAGKDQLGRVIVQLSDGTQYVKTVLTEAENDDENYYPPTSSLQSYDLRSGFGQ